VFPTSDDARPADAPPLRLGVHHLRLAAAPHPLLVRRDRPFDATVPAVDVADTLRYVAAARRTLPGPLALEIEGPGDPLASPESVLRVLALLHEHHPDVLTGLVVDGPLLAEYVEELDAFGLRYLVLRMDAATPRTARALFDGGWYRGDVLDRDAAADLALPESRRALDIAARWGFPLVVRFTLVPTVNAREVADVARVAATRGAGRMDVVPHAPADGAPLARAGVPTPEELDDARAVVAATFASCGRRPGDADSTLAWLDAAHLVPVDVDALDAEDVLRILPSPDEPDREAAVLPPRRAQLVAVATGDGVLVDMPLATAPALRIYAVTPSAIRLVGSRALPVAPRRRHDGVGDAPEFLAALVGCRAVLATQIPPRAATLLRAVGIVPLAQAGPVEALLDRAARGTICPSAI
jgi:nitrogen fixation protein NifB